VRVKRAVLTPDSASRNARRRRQIALAAALLAGSAAWMFVRPGRSEAFDRAGLKHEVLELKGAGNVTRVHRFGFAVARLKIEVVDLAYETPLGDALGDADFVVNGGFWGWHKSQRRVIGLLRSGGQELSPLRAALDGGVLMLGGGRASIAPSKQFRVPPGLEFAVQCKPRLVQTGTLVGDLNAHSRAARTAVCVRDAGRALDVYLSDPLTPGPTLSELASWLAAQGCEHALNLDGGPSTAAAYLENGKLVRIGAGVELPYALRFSRSPLQGASQRGSRASARALLSRAARRL
jgi:uncharacterized protein YigE (DUF2233 family)